MLWCRKEAIQVTNSNPRANLKVHRDGHPQVDDGYSVCPGQNRAIAAGAKLPPTISEVKAIARAKAQTKLSLFGIEQSKNQYNEHLMN